MHSRSINQIKSSQKKWIRMALSSQRLRYGAWYAIEQAGRLLRAATVLADNDDPITGVMIAMFAREELGRYMVLRKSACRVDRGEMVERGDLEEACNKHIRKQQEGALSTTLRSDPNSVLDTALREMMAASPLTEKWNNAKQIADLAAKKKRERDPNDRHEMRIRSLYVDLNESGSDWFRPSKLDTSIARQSIGDAVNDYASQYHRLCDDGIGDDQTQMALARPPDCMLAEPTWPRLTGRG